MGIANEANKEDNDEYFDRRKIINQPENYYCHQQITYQKMYKI